MVRLTSRTQEMPPAWRTPDRQVILSALIADYAPAASSSTRVMRLARAAADVAAGGLDSVSSRRAFQRAMSDLAGAVSSTTASAGGGAFSPLTYPYPLVSGPAPGSYPVTYGSKTLTSSSVYDSGSGTPSDPWIYNGHMIRNDPALNVFGDPLGSTNGTAILSVAASNVRVVNCYAPSMTVATPLTNSVYTNVTFDHCKSGLYDYKQPTAPTVNRYTGLPFTSSPPTFRQFWWNTSTRVAYALPVGGTTWVYAGEYWAFLQYDQPTSGMLPGHSWNFVQDGNRFPGTGYRANGYFRWNGTTWVDIANTIDPNVTGSNNGQNLGGISSGPVNNCTVINCEVEAIEDGCFTGWNSAKPANAGIRYHYNWFTSNTFCRGRFGPHSDQLQTTGVQGMKIQRNRFDGDVTVYGYNAGSTPPYDGRYNSNMILQNAQGPVDDILISQNWLRKNFHSMQIRGSATNVRIRNNYAQNGTGELLNYDSPPTGPTWKWSGNKDESGVVIPPSSSRLGKSTPASQTPVDDGDPTGEGLVLG